MNNLVKHLVACVGAVTAAFLCTAPVAHSQSTNQNNTFVQAPSGSAGALLRRWRYSSGMEDGRVNDCSGCDDPKIELVCDDDSIRVELPGIGLFKEPSTRVIPVSIQIDSVTLNRETKLGLSRSRDGYALRYPIELTALDLQEFSLGRTLRIIAGARSVEVPLFGSSDAITEFRQACGPFEAGIQMQAQEDFASRNFLQSQEGTRLQSFMGRSFEREIRFSCPNTSVTPFWPKARLSRVNGNPVLIRLDLPWYQGPGGVTHTRPYINSVENPLLFMDYAAVSYGTFSDDAVEVTFDPSFEQNGRVFMNVQVPEDAGLICVGEPLE